MMVSTSLTLIVWLAEVSNVPIMLPLEETYTGSWDGTEYERVCVDDGKEAYLGNRSIFGSGDDTGEPFLYSLHQNAFATLDTAASHTISVTRVEETVTPMAEEFIPHMNVSAFTNDAGYLTLATLPKYGGEVV